jgi:TldD protein
MQLSRRQMFVGSGICALGTACDPAARAPANAPAGARSGSLSGAATQDTLARALEAAKRGGAGYADARVVRRRTERIATREDHVVSVDATESYGVGVRVLVRGAWGFAATASVDGASAARAAEQACAMALAASTYVKKPVELAPCPAARDAWQTPMQIDPFAVPLADKAAFLLDLWPMAHALPSVKFMSAWFEAVDEHKVLATSEGALVEQRVTRVFPGYSVTAVRNGEFESRKHELPPMQAGWEYVTRSSLKKDARAMAEDAVTKLEAPSVAAGKRDLVLAPSNLWLTIHESVGHPTELDRILGYEANLAGTSFATLEKLGKLQYGSPLVTLFADKTAPGGLATCGYDDDGVRTQRWDLVKDGVYVGVQTTRDQAGWIGEKASRGTSYADDYKTVAFQRMPNVSLAAGAKEASLDDLVAATEDGVLVTGDGSWSIDHQRYNFQFSGQMFYAIKKGKIAGPLKDVAYQSNSLDFWRSCDMVGGPKSWELHGTMWDGKGEPGQANAVSHGCPPARFRQVSVLDTNRRRGS